MSTPHMGGHEMKFIDEAFAGDWIVPLGPNVDGFEKDLQTFNKVTHAAALSSGTAALHLALILHDIGPGDLVFVQSFTFCATVNPIVYQGATPVFIDSEPNTWNMSPDALEDAITRYRVPSTEYPNRKAVILPVHLYGMPANMDAIMEIAAKYSLPVIEDAAESIGSTYHDQHTGTFGKMGVYSFNGNKIITTSGGGALVSEDEALIQKARFLATQARDPAPHYQHSEIGYNYRLSNVLAGIGRGQMQILPERIAQRRANHQRYRQYFEKWNAQGFDIRFQEEPAGSFSNRWLTAILINPASNHGITRETIRLALEEANIESRPLWKPMHLQPVFKNHPYVGSGIAEQLFDTGLCLPSGSSLTDEDFGRIFAVLDHTFS